MDKPKILLIEDERDIAEIYKEVLEEAGYYVVVEYDGKEGLRTSLEEPWDLLLLDIMLPGEDGLNVLEQVCSKDYLKNKPIVLLTNLGGEDLIKKAFEIGATSYLIKSEITPDKIVDEVANYLPLES